MHLRLSQALIKMGLHPSEIISGYITAGQKVTEIMESLVIENIAKEQMHDVAVLKKGIYSAISAKQHGREEILVNLVAEACLTVMPKNPYNFNVDNVRVAKMIGGSLSASRVIKGMVFNRDTVGTLKKVKDAKIAVFTCSIAPSDTESKGTVLIHNADDLMNYNLSEEREIEATIKAIADSGVNVVVTGSSIDDMAAHFLEKFGIMTLKLSSKFELRRLCRATKARPTVQLGPISPEHMGYCSEVYVTEVGLRKVTVFKQEENDSTSVATVVLRSATGNQLNDLERAIDDGVNVVKSMARDGRFVAGAGAADIEAARLLSKIGAKVTGLDQYAIRKYAEALEVVPRILSENAGMKTMDIISKLYAVHEGGDVNVGINVDDAKVEDMSKKGIIDLLKTKLQAIKLATDAAVTILRVDQIIQAKPAGGPKTGGRQGHWDDDD